MTKVPMCSEYGVPVCLCCGSDNINRVTHTLRSLSKSDWHLLMLSLLSVLILVSKVWWRIRHKLKVDNHTKGAFNIRKRFHGRDGPQTCLYSKIEMHLESQKKWNLAGISTILKTGIRCAECKMVSTWITLRTWPPSESSSGSTIHIPVSSSGSSETRKNYSTRAHG